MKTYQYKERQFELVIKGGDPKLTITPTRITVKLPPSITDIHKYEQWAKLVVDEIPLDSPSLRGRFKEDSLTLQSDNKEICKSFNFEVVHYREAGYYEPVIEKVQAFGEELAREFIVGYKRVDV